MHSVSDLYLVTEVCFHPGEGFSFVFLLPVGKCKQQFSCTLEFIIHNLPYHLALETFAIKHRQYTQNVKLWRVRVTIFPTEIKQCFLSVLLDYMSLSTIYRF
jgi:hypothetical protein